MKWVKAWKQVGTFRADWRTDVVGNLPSGTWIQQFKSGFSVGEGPPSFLQELLGGKKKNQRLLLVDGQLANLLTEPRC